jgi:single-stranded DNA-binding protein
MNIFVGSGRLTRNAVVNGTENKAMKFTIAAGCGYKDRAEKEKVEFVHCVLFNPPEDLEAFLVEEGKGVFVEIQGRVSTSRFEVDGEVKYSTQVVVGRGKLNIAKD